MLGKAFMSCCPTSPEMACAPDAIPAEQRRAHFALAHQLFSERAQERTDLPNGYAFRFAPESFEAVASFVANERRCCPFMSFELTLTPAPGALWLRMTGPEGTREVLKSELNLPHLCGCGS